MSTGNKKYWESQQRYILSNKKPKKRKPKLFDFEHVYRVAPPINALISFDDTNRLDINVDGMKPKDIDMELNMFLTDDSVIDILLTFKCGCRKLYNNYGTKKKEECCSEHVKVSNE